MKRKSTLVAFLFLVLVGTCVSIALAQTTTSVLEGTVVDSTGAVLPGVAIEVKGGTVSRAVLTDTQGFYRAVALPAGPYTVTASLSGFKTKVLEKITLVLNRTATLDITMEVAPQTETVTVTGALPLIDTSNSSTKQVIDVATIDAIPLNGRNFLDLILLTPGVAVNTQARSSLTDRDTKGSILGDRAGNTVFLIDGLENSDGFHGGVFQAFTQDAIQEFEVISAGYKAEFGRGSGGVINVVSKTGSNAFHGNTFVFLRNDGLDSSNVSGEEAPELSRYDYGVTLGGPIRKDKAWFFGSVERVQEDRAALFPPNIPPRLLASEDFSRVPETSDIRAFGKYTQRVNDKNDFRASLSWTRAERLNKLANDLALPSASNNSLTHTWLGTVALTTVFSPKLILDSSFGIRSQDFDQNQDIAAGLGFSSFFLDDGTSFDWGPPGGSIQTLDQRYYTFREVLSFFVGGKHSAKAGFEFTRISADGTNGQGLATVILTVRPLFELYGNESFSIPQGTAFLNPGDGLSRLRNNGTSLFLQDDWQVVPGLTLSGGLRYDYDSRFGVKDNFAPRLGFAWSPDKKTVIQMSLGRFYDRYRLGLAQPVPELGGFTSQVLVEFNYPRLANDALLGNPGPSLFAMLLGDPGFINTQFGIPFGTLVTENNIQSLTGLSPADFLVALNLYLTGLGFGIPFTPLEWSPLTGFLRQDLGQAFVTDIRVARPFKTPYNDTFTVGFQRELTQDFVLGATYVHRRIQNIQGVRITNLSPAARLGQQLLTTDGGPAQREYGPWYDGDYDAFILSFNKRFSRRFQIQGNYTYARAKDNLLNSNLGLGINTVGGGALPSDNLDLEFDRGNSDLLVPHAFVTSGLVELPVGFRISGVLRATSGVYFSAFGALFDLDGDGIATSRPPSTTRNEFLGPASLNIDFRIEKSFRFAERYVLSGLVDFFNLTNRANPRTINNSFVSGVPVPEFGTALVPQPGREIQFGVRFRF